MSITITNEATITDGRAHDTLRTLASMGMDGIIAFEEDMDTTPLEVDCSVKDSILAILAEEALDPELCAYELEIGNDEMNYIVSLLTETEELGQTYLIVQP